jgi:hypothetical protein
MIRFTARFPIAVDDVAAVDAFTDRIMEALLLDGDVVDPDVAVSMTERALEIHLLVPSDDPLDAVDRGNRALTTAFAAAGHPGVPSAQVLMHRDLLGPNAAMHTELVTS